ncbi:hypothetical protein KP509_26G064300 [Ceratopteris richardii]|uniref:Uncharacterized protein n=1 Tax=Ceratopteris richardii TaxID=49495 RepID=A0A8T2RMT5_CERRI|nr:hypothetical protein KP509_26G064300 [Ceratopteris richardii]
MVKLHQRTSCTARRWTCPRKEKRTLSIRRLTKLPRREHFCSISGLSVATLKLRGLLCDELTNILQQTDCMGISVLCEEYSYYVRFLKRIAHSRMKPLFYILNI